MTETAEKRRVTVLMSTYNSEEYLAPAIESILSQTFSDFEFVIYDDASTDESLSVIKSFNDDRIVIRQRASNVGLTANLREGVERASGDYIARMDADDIAMPTRLEEQVAFLDRHFDVDVLGSDVIFFDDHGSESIGRQPQTHEDICLSFFFDFTMMHPTIMLRASTMRAHNWNYDPAFRYSQDFDLWSRMQHSHKFANLGKPLLRLREHGKKVTRRNWDEQQNLTNMIRRRQISCLVPDVSDGQFAAFCGAARGDTLPNVGAISDLKQITLALIAANAQMKIYQVESFREAACSFFRVACWRMLKSGGFAGAAFWNRDLLFIAKLKPRQLLSMAGHTARAGLIARTDAKLKGDTGTGRQ